ncbi:MAG: hypothetical protein EOP45_10575 [Sphingobacteriaceae bacterium]|nr:MAG: hypothetical protein EOP45_10575 [Sphingobacteriaceae bacterium]
MIPALLLQASATPQPTPYAVYATLAVGVLSLIASGLNIFFSSRTAQKVVNLSTKTTREVAELSAQVSRESAGLAAQTAREIKEIDYKNDFYKKIIERRLNAWESAEEFINLMGGTFVDQSDKAIIPSYFANSNRFDDVINQLHSRYSKMVWLGSAYTNHMTHFHNRLIAMRYECLVQNKSKPRVEGVPSMEDLVIEDRLLIIAGKKYFRECSSLLDKLVKILGFSLRSMHDVEAYLIDVEGLGINIPERFEFEK